jgi:DNA-3-methyladenine glycosylase II
MACRRNPEPVLNGGSSEPGAAVMPARVVADAAGARVWLFSVPLPSAYQGAGVLAFHRRDPLALAEQVGSDRLRKGIVYTGVPLVLDITLQAGAAQCSIHADGPLDAAALASLPEAVRGLLGLRIAPEPFEQAVAGDAWFGALVARQPGLRIAQAASCFEALSWAIIGQQINLPFAIALRRAFITLGAVRHSSGLWCYPQAAEIARLDAAALGAHKFSRAKAETLIRVARLIEDGALPLAQLADAPLDELQARLLAIKGIGPWTVNYTLLRGYGLADCSLHGDAAVKNALHRLSGAALKPGNNEAQRMLEPYRPYRSMACAHLWASLHVPAAISTTPTTRTSRTSHEQLPSGN